MSNALDIDYVRSKVAEIAKEDGDYESQRHLVMQLFIDVLLKVSTVHVGFYGEGSKIRDLAFEALKAKRFL